MTEPPRVSVLMPVFNAETWLGDCLKSLSRQTLEDFELIAVDDGSEDGSGDLLRQWAERDPRIRVVGRQHAGLVAALNAGLEHCRAPYVARLDADDAAHPRRLELQVESLDNHPEVGVVSCRVRHFPRQRIGRGFALYEDWINGLRSHDDIVRERFVESPIAHPSVLVRRKVLVDAGGWREGQFPEDYELWLRLIEAGVRFSKRPEPLHLWREHSGRATRTDDRYAVDRFLWVKARYLARGPLARSPAEQDTPYVVRGAGPTGRALSKHLIAEGATPNAFLDVDPRKIGRRVRGRPVYDAEALPNRIAEEPRTKVVTAVASRGARALIRDRLTGWGLVEDRDFWCAA